MKFLNLKERILKRSSFDFRKNSQDRYEFDIECIGYKYTVTFSTNIQYQNSETFDIDEQLKNILVNGLIETEGFVNTLNKIENRERNLEELL